MRNDKLILAASVLALGLCALPYGCGGKSVDPGHTDSGCENGCSTPITDDGAYNGGVDGARPAYTEGSVDGSGHVYTEGVSVDGVGNFGDGSTRFGDGVGNFGDGIPRPNDADGALEESDGEGYPLGDGWSDGADGARSDGYDADGFSDGAP